MSLERAGTENAPACSMCCNIISLGSGIAALVIGLQYDSSSACNDDTKYFIDLKDYLLIAGGVVISWNVLSCILTCIGAICLSDLSRNKYAPWMFAIFTCPSLTFSFAWSVIGLYIYSNEMSDQCQNAPIGQMILAWAIIQILCSGPAMCIMGCLLCSNL